MLQREKLLQKTRREKQDRFARRNSTRLYDKERVQAMFQALLWDWIGQGSNTNQRVPPQVQCEHAGEVFRDPGVGLEDFVGPILAGLNGRLELGLRSLCQNWYGLRRHEVEGVPRAQRRNSILAWWASPRQSVLLAANQPSACPRPDMDWNLAISK